MSTRNTIDCTTCRTSLEDMLLDSNYQPSVEVELHLNGCAACRTELDELRATMALLDDWTAPEPSPYFDARVHAHLREAAAAAPTSLWVRLMATLHLSTHRALAGAFVFVLLLGGGTVATLWGGHSNSAPATPSPALHDLQILDNNAQALQQLDMLDEQGAQAQTADPQS